MKTSTLAAVVAAAAGGEGATASAQPAPLTLESLKLQHPDIHAAAVAEGATAERERIASIEAQAMPGHEAIIKACKADGTKTGADAAMAIVAAENANRTKQLGALSKDEEAVKGLRNAPVTTANEPASSSTATSAELRDAASTYIAEQAAKGITVSAAQAVARVSKQ
jgi:hypothetical protein